MCMCVYVYVYITRGKITPHLSQKWKSQSPTW